MTAIIIEDEKWTADRLRTLVEQAMPDLQIEAVLTSVTNAYSWFIDHKVPDLIFMDIELGDGTAFDLLEILDIKTHVIFTTAYNNYAIEAFKYNSIDYLLKPINIVDLKKSLDKWVSLKPKSTSTDLILELKRAMGKSFKQRFLVRNGDKYQTIETGEIAFFFSEDSYTHLKLHTGKQWIIDYSLEDLDEIMDPKSFFRLNRKVMASIKSIAQIASYFNGRLVVQLNPELEEQIVISREKVKPFKSWLDQ